MYSSCQSKGDIIVMPYLKKGKPSNFFFLTIRAFIIRPNNFSDLTPTNKQQVSINLWGLILPTFIFAFVQFSFPYWNIFLTVFPSKILLLCLLLLRALSGNFPLTLQTEYYFTLLFYYGIFFTCFFYYVLLKLFIWMLLPFNSIKYKSWNHHICVLWIWRI